MALSAPTALTAAVSSGTDAAITSGSFTPAASSLIVVTLGSFTANGTGTLAWTISDTLGTLTWTKVEANNGGTGNATTATLWYAVAPSSPIAGTVTATPSYTGVASFGVYMQPFQITGGRTSGPVGATGTSASATVNLSAAPASTSEVILVGAAGQGSDPVTTQPTGFTALYTDQHAGTYTYVSTGYKNGSAAQSNAFGSLPNPAAVGIEVLVASGAGVVTVNSPGSPSGTVGVAFSQAITASTTSGTINGYTATGLPPGLSINATTGVISGTPTTAGGYSVTVSATDTSGDSGTSPAFVITISSAVVATTRFALSAFRVEAAWTTTSALAVSPNWEDMTSLVALEQGVSCNRGRPDSQSAVSAGQFTFALRNEAGDFTPGKQSSPRYPNIVLGRRVRLTYRTPGSSGNFLSAEDSSFEGGTTGSWNNGSLLGFSGGTTLANSTAQANVGTHSLLATWPAGGGAVGLNASGLVIGRSYTATAQVYVPAGSPAVTLEAFTVATGTSTGSTTGAFVRLSVTFTAQQTVQYLDLKASSVGSAYVDAVQVDEASGSGTYTTSTPPVATMWDGTINAVNVDIDTAQTFASITATDLLKQVGEQGAFRSILGEEILYDTPTAYWPLGEQSGASAAGDVSGAAGVGALVPTQVGAGGSATFAGGTGPQYDGQSAVTFAPASVGNGVYLRATGSPNLTNNASGVYNATLEAFVNTSTAAAQVICRTQQSGGGYISLEVTAAGKLLAVVSDGVNVLGSVTSASNVTGGTKHVAATVTLTGTPATTATLTAYLDGTSAGTATWTQSAGYLYFFDTMSVGGVAGGSLLAGTVSHVALGINALSSTRIGVHRNAGLTGFIGELSGTRAARLLRLAGIDPALQNIEAGLSTMDYQDTTGAAPMSALQDVVNAERGVFFAAADGRLTFHGRSHRYNAGAAATFDSAADLGSPTFHAYLNDQLLINDVTGQRPAGATQRSVNTTSIAANGTYAQTITLIVDSDNLAANIVQSIANTYSVPQPRTPDLTVDVLTISASQAQSALGLDIGSRVDVTNLPASAPASSLSLFVEGVTVTLGTSQAELKFATSPATYTAVWVLDSATYSQLDSSTILSL